MASAGWWACSFSVPVLLGISISGSSFGPDSFLCLISGHLVRGVEWVARNPQTENMALASRGRFLFLRMTSKTVGCCDVQVVPETERADRWWIAPLGCKEVCGHGCCRGAGSGLRLPANLGRVACEVSVPATHCWLVDPMFLTALVGPYVAFLRSPRGDGSKRGTHTTDK